MAVCDSGKSQEGACPENKLGKCIVTTTFLDNAQYFNVYTSTLSGPRQHSQPVTAKSRALTIQGQDFARTHAPLEI